MKMQRAVPRNLGNYGSVSISHFFATYLESNVTKLILRHVHESLMLDLSDDMVVHNMVAVVVCWVAIVVHYICALLFAHIFLLLGNPFLLLVASPRSLSSYRQRSEYNLV